MSKKIVIFLTVLSLIVFLLLVIYFFSDELKIAKLNLKYYNYDLAIERLNKVLIKNPHHPEAHLYLGLAYLRKGKEEEALKEFNWLRENFPKITFPASIHNEIGMSYYIKEKYAEAIEEFKKAISLNSNYAEAYFNLGVAYSSLGEIDKAISAYKNVIRINPRNIYAHWNLAVNLEKLGDLEGAIYHWRKYIQYTPGVFRHQEVEIKLKELEEKLKLLKENRR